MHYQKHVFFCTNLKDHGKKCCQQGHASDMCHHAKEQLKLMKNFGPGKVRVSSSGCLGRCELGPCMVVYPEGVWYRYSSQQDVDLIIEKHLMNNEVVPELLIDQQASD